MFYKFSAALFLGLLITCAFPQQQARALSIKDPVKSYRADNFDVYAGIQSDGSLVVLEQITFSFTGGPFTTVFREIPTYKTDNVKILAASMDDQSTDSISPDVSVDYSFHDKIGVYWHFNDLYDSAHTFTLRYQIQGIIQRGANADILDWNALPIIHDYPIQASTIVVTYPDRAVPLGNPVVAQGQGEISTDNNQTSLYATNLDVDQPLEIQMQFRSGSVISTPPLWQQYQEMNQTLLLPSLLGGFIILVLVLYLLLRYTRKYRRRTPKEFISPTKIRPNDLPPAIVGALISKNPEKINKASFVALLLDLANRDVLCIRQGSRTYYSKTSFQIELLSQPSDLLPYERNVLDTVFKSKRGSGKVNVIEVSTITLRYAGSRAIFAQSLIHELQERGFFDVERQRVRKRLSHIWQSLFFLGLGGLLLMLIFTFTSVGYPWPLVFLFLEPLVLAFVTLGFSENFSILSDKGWVEAQPWRSFARYLSTSTAYNHKILGSLSEAFERYLPYAASFGIASSWTNSLHNSNKLLMPHWFHVLEGTEGNANSSFISMIRVLTGEPDDSSNYTGSSHYSSSNYYNSGGGSSGGSFSSGGAAGGGTSGAY